VQLKGGWVTPNFKTVLRDYAHPSFIHLGRFEIDDMTGGTVQYGGTEVVDSERTVRYDGMLQIVNQSSCGMLMHTHGKIYSIYLSSRSMTVTAQKCCE